MNIYLMHEGVVERLVLRKPYSADARRFIRGFYHSYRCSTTIAQMARELGVPESTMRRIVRDENDGQSPNDNDNVNRQTTLFS